MIDQWRIHPHGKWLKVWAQMVHYKCNLSIIASGRHACFYARGKGADADLLYKSALYTNARRARFAALAWFLMASRTQIISFDKDLHLPSPSRSHWLSDPVESSTTFGVVLSWGFFCPHLAQAF